MNLCECDILNPLTRDGTNQVQRYLKTLKPSYVKVDEKELDDLIIYARQYAEYVKYYDTTIGDNSSINWVEFIRSNITTVISMISKTDPEEGKNNYNDEKEKVYNLFKGDKTKNIDETELKPLFKIIYDFAYRFNDWYETSTDQISLKKDLKINIESSLSDTLNNLLFLAASMSNSSGKLLEISADEFSDIWDLKTYSITPKYTSKINYDETNEIIFKINSLFKEFYNSLKNLQKSVEKYFDEALNKFPYHQPHFALFLTFLQLFKHAQNHINKITERHLDFYYKEILRLKPKDAVPDNVHVIFELAKNVSKYAVRKDTSLKAGKDNKSVDLYYGTDKEIVVNKSEVSFLKTIFIDRETKQDEQIVKSIYSAPVANSKDGTGTDFDGEDKKWKTFGESQDKKLATETTMLNAALGFAIASPQFYLSEGIRNITLKIKCDTEGFSYSGLRNMLKKNPLKYELSGEKKWIEATIEDKITVDDYQIKIPLKLGQDKPAVVALNSKKLIDTFNTKLPVLKISFKQENNAYEYFKDLIIKSININVTVKNVTNLLLQNDVGLLDAAKPFQPFRPVPTINSSFYIGSEEIFNKQISDLKINLEWLGLPDVDDFEDYYSVYGTYKRSDYKVSLFLLDNYSWTEKTTNGQLKELFTDSKIDDPKPIEFDLSLGNRENELEEFKQFSNSLKKGFIKLELRGKDFGHSAYSKLLTEKVIDKVKTPATTLPNPPYTPLVKSINVEYTSDAQYDGDIDQFFQIYPFGHVETLPIEGKSKKDSSTKSSSTDVRVKTKSLMPQFKFDGTEQEGILYVGVKDLDPPQNLNLLFQIAEGSGDFSVNPPKKINWCYLTNNIWKAFESKEIISDSTNDLKTTGIIELDIPKEASSNNTILDSKYYWIRASVENSSKAINQIIDVQSQAVSASFRDNKNDPDHLKNALPAETISKLATRVPEIKTITQPFASFGGKVKEQSDEFYTRVSERLRHKNRPINVWDYERLILEKYSSIYKVKCLNHTGPDSELSPGYVTIIPISNLRNKNAIDKLKPSTSINTLDLIKKYLIKHVSPCVQIFVENPEYEKVQVDFKVEFHQGVDKGYYTQKLIDEIIRFLSPWAFEEGKDIIFGGKIHSSSIINFVEERSYVDYLTDFKLFHYMKNKAPLDVEEAKAATSKSILVSHKTHIVNLVEV